MVLAGGGPASARVGLVTVPHRDAVQLTIYNSADLTLVREARILTLAKGRNRLEFSWSGTLIDPTSVQFDARTHSDAVDVIDVSFPPGAPNALVWTLESDVEGEVSVEISYFTSGISWLADYEAVVGSDERRMSLNSYVKVTNRSGETYENSQVRLVVGTIHLVENIAVLANRAAGNGIEAKVQKDARARMYDYDKSQVSISGYIGAVPMEGLEVASPPVIVREGLSEYFIYTVGGRHEVSDRWSTRWLNFTQDEIPVRNFYRYEEGRYNKPNRFLKLRNKKEDKLGEEPLPDGRIHAYLARQDGTRVYLGGSLSKYIPVGEDWEIGLGVDPDVIVKPTLKKRAVENVEFDEHGNPSGWNVHESWTLDVLNSRERPVTVEIDRNFADDHTVTGIRKEEQFDIDTIRFGRDLAPRSRMEIAYDVEYRRGTRKKR